MPPEETLTEKTDEKKEGETEQSATLEKEKTTEVSTETKSDEGEEGGGEPVGADGESVYRRKLYRENKQLQERLRQEQLEKAELSGRLKAKEEIEEPDRIYTSDELQAAVDAGQITQAGMTAYMVNQRIKAERQAEQERANRERPIFKAREEIEAYKDVAPWLNDINDPKYEPVLQEFHHLVRDLGLSKDSPVTEALAVRNVLGPVDKLKKQREASNLTSRTLNTHSEQSAGGNREAANGDALSKVPKDLIDGWKATGATDAQLKKYAQHHLEKMQRRRAHFGV